MKQPSVSTILSLKKVHKDWILRKIQSMEIRITLKSKNALSDTGLLREVGNCYLFLATLHEALTFIDSPLYKTYVESGKRVSFNYFKLKNS